MSKQKIVLFDIDYTLFDTDYFKKTNLQTHRIYDEVEDVLHELSQIALLGIFSEGELVFQQTKLEKTGIVKYFVEEYIHIVGAKNEVLAEVLHKYKDATVFLVDDKLEVLKNASDVLPSLVTIWVKRGIYAQNQKPIESFAPHGIIDTLQEVIPIVTAYK